MAAVASQLQEFLNSSQRDVEFRVDAETHLQVVTVRDSVTGQVIRQFPNEDVIRVVKNLTAQQGTLLDEAV
jgi:flagellar protein FlaG